MKVRVLFVDVSMEMSRLKRDGTAEAASRDQIMRRERGQINFPIQLTMSRVGNLTRLILTLATVYVMTMHTHIHTHINTTILYCTGTTVVVKVNAIPALGAQVFPSNDMEKYWYGS